DLVGPPSDRRARASAPGLREVNSVSLDYRPRWRTCTLLLLPVKTAPRSRCLAFFCQVDPEGCPWVHQLAWGAWTSKSRLCLARIRLRWLPMPSMGSKSAQALLESSRIGRAGNMHSSPGDDPLGKVPSYTFRVRICECRSLEYP